MSRPRRVADGPFVVAPIEVRSSTPRRAIARPTVADRLRPSAVALAASATAGAIAVATVSGLTLSRSGADAASSATPTAQTSVRDAQNLSAVVELTSDDAEQLAVVRKIVVQRVAEERAAAAESAASEKAAADDAAAHKAAMFAKALGKFGPASRYGLKGGAVKTYQVVLSNFDGINAIGGYRPTSLSNHQLGLAIDFMITPGAESALGWSIAKFVAAHAKELNVDHVIFEQHIWTPATPTWRLMEDRGSITDNHFDHVHVSMKS